MPRISVTERDLSWYFRQRGKGAATVYIPGIATFGPENDPVLCDSTNFANVFGTKPVDIKDELSYSMAASFIKSGFNVLFHRFVPSGATKASSYVGDGTNKVTFTAKYDGTFGNSISLVLRSLGGSKGTSSVFVSVEGTLVETLSVNFIDPTSEKYYTNIDSGYVDIAVSGDATLIEFGSATSPTKLTLTGGRDYTEGKDSSEIRTEICNAISTEGALDDLKDPYQYDFDVAISAGFPQYTEGAEKMDPVDKALFELAAGRGTSIFLVDGDRTWDDAQMYSYCGLFNSSFSAAFGPWSYAQLTNLGVTALLPGSYSMIVAWAQSCSDGNPLWMAPAGVKRASLGSFFKNTYYPVGKKTLDMWQNHDYVQPGQYSVNPIMKAKQYGYVIYGNSTLLKTRDDGATSMLQSFSVRVMANLIKSRAFDVSLSLQFDQLTNDLFVQFKSLLGVYMDQLRYQNALYDYEIVLANNTLTSADLNEKRVPVIIRISPNPAAENFDIALEITQAGVSFSDETDETEIG